MMNVLSIFTNHQKQYGKEEFTIRTIHFKKLVKIWQLKRENRPDGTKNSGIQGMFPG